MKKLYFMFMFILLFSCGNNKYKEYIKDINSSIENIQKSINTANKDLFNNHSTVNEFFKFYSMIAMASKTLEQNKDVIVLKPVRYSGDDKKISVEIEIKYNISSLKDLNLGIPVDVFNNIVKMGLPNKMTLNNRFIATSIKFPLRYFYMNLLIPSEENIDSN